MYNEHLALRKASVCKILYMGAVCHYNLFLSFLSLLVYRPGVEKFLAHDKLLYNAERKTQYLKNDTLHIRVVKVTLDKN